MTGDIIVSNLINNSILSIELRNDNKNNALSFFMIDKLIKLLKKKNLRKAYKMIILRGHNDGAFSAGADLDDLDKLENKNNLNIYHKKLNLLLETLRKLDIIKISAVNRFCIGAGFILAMNTDICIASSNCKFSVPAALLDIKLSPDQINFLVTKFPSNLLLKEILLSGRVFSAKEAYNFKIINKIAKKGSFKPAYVEALNNILKSSNEIRDHYYKILYRV
tara:strand:- start:418 stop:1080 length:663 start_codon:yes stop_codon:yes gene_type:complete